jgi:hypothetical protein
MDKGEKEIQTEKPSDKDAEKILLDAKIVARWAETPFYIY